MDLETVLRKRNKDNHGSSKGSIFHKELQKFIELISHRMKKLFFVTKYNYLLAINIIQRKFNNLKHQSRMISYQNRQARSLTIPMSQLISDNKELSKQISLCNYLKKT